MAGYSAFFLQSHYGTTNVAITVDANGMRHAAFSEWNGDAIFYGTCSASCGEAAGWQFVRIFDSGVEFGYEPSEVQIDLDSAGRPRIAFEVHGYGTASEGYFYAECNSGCLSPTGWRVLNFAEADQSTVSSSEWFTVAADDSVHAITLYSREGFLGDQHISIHYNVCDRDCTSASSWRSHLLVDLGNLGFLAPSVNTSLGIDAHRRARLALFARFDSGYGALYLECNSACENARNWGGVDTTGLWGGGLVLALDSRGQPHVATFGAQSVRYLWCEGGCLDVDSWAGVELNGLPSGAGSLGMGLAIDPQDEPHIAYATAGGRSVGYLRCATGCDQRETSRWLNQLVEHADFPAYPQYPGCAPPVDQAWVLNGPISLGIAPDGSVTLGYAAANIQGSYCLDPRRVADVAVRIGRIASLAAPDPVGGPDGGEADAGVDADGGNGDSGPVDGGVEHGERDLAPGDADVDPGTPSRSVAEDAGPPPSVDTIDEAGEDGCRCASDGSRSPGWGLFGLGLLVLMCGRRMSCFG